MLLGFRIDLESIDLESVGLLTAQEVFHYQPHLPGFDLLLENNFETRNLNLFPNVIGQTGVVFSLLSNTVSESQSSFALRRYGLS